MPGKTINQVDSDWYDQKYDSNTTRTYCWNKKIFELIRANKILGKETRILEIGCGEGNLLKNIHEEIGINKDKLYGIEQSEKAVLRLKDHGFKNIKCTDAKNIPFKDKFFDIVIMAEVIEHLRDPDAVLAEIRRILKNNGIIILSFPNYLNLPWLLLRYIAEISSIADRMINLQPYDKIFTYFHLIKYVESNEFKFLKSYGTNYLPPGLHLIEPMGLSNIMTKMRLTFLSFHPVLIFKHNEKSRKQGIGE